MGLGGDHDFDAFHTQVGVECFLDLVEWELVGDEAFHGQADAFGALKKVVGVWVVGAVVDPGADDGDFLFADVFMRVDFGFTAVDEVADLDDGAAAANHMKDVGEGLGHAGDLEAEVDAESFGQIPYGFGEGVDIGVVFVVENVISAERLGHPESVIVSIQGNDVVDAVGA